MHEHETVIHGELSPPNVITHEDDVVFIDWETAAVGAAEIDLVALTDQ